MAAPDDTAARESYQGDEALGRLLAEAGSRYDPEAVRSLIAGVLAAPEDRDPDAWVALVAPAPGDSLRAQLGALKAQVSASRPETALPDAAARLAALRAELKRRGLAGFAVPHADEHQGENLPGRAQRLTWLTGFSGSAGIALVLGDKAAIFVDGRYTLQVRDQVDTALFAPQHVTDEPPAAWIEANLPKDGKLGYDPWLHTRKQVETLGKAAEKAGGALVAVADNPIDALWADQPPPPVAPVVAHDSAFAGRSSAEKRQELAESLQKQGLGAAVLTLPDSIAWLLNVRGGDVASTPLPLSFAILAEDGTVQWFIDPRKPAPGLERHLGNGVEILPPAELGPALDRAGAAGRPVLADAGSAPAWIFQRLAAAGAAVTEGADPCQLPKARKNETELAGTRAAHRRDGAALTRFLAWLDGEARSRAEAGEPVGELEAAARLAAFRRGDEGYRGPSFDTISGAGANGAIVHYRASAETERRLEAGSLFLVDSGGQYRDGTTDVTRTVAIGQPSAEMRDRFTRVLKGHIALATVRFPKGTTGSQLDPLARAALWRAGLDYDHGTGHGVGSYLGVHEGPQRISKVANGVALEPGMIVSNEPGYYKTGAYGIRIENLVVVAESEPEGSFKGERQLYAFETLTLAPIDRALIDPALLSAEERAWLDAYHARVRETLTPLLDKETAAWLKDATQPV